jgi:hypothetical protein
MGRSFESVCQGMKSIADRWTRSSRALKKEDQWYGERLVELAKKHSSETFIACDHPLENCCLLSTCGDHQRQDRTELILKEDVDF